MTTGLPKTDKKNPRFHFDIYAILEGAQELYFGHETQVNVNLVEKIKMLGKGGEALEKCYISPTKRRGVERRCLLWSPVKNGELLGDKQECGIPDTCTSPDCPVCAAYGGLRTKDKGNKKRATLIGRLTHGGGVAVQDIYPVEKQRAMHPGLLNRNEKTTKHLEKEDKEPTPYKRQYNQPGILYPVYNHALSLTDNEFAAVAYAFLDSLPRIGAGNPKGIGIAESDEVPLLVLDRYLVPQKKRPIISPAIIDPQAAIANFKRLGNFEDSDGNYIEKNHFERWIGNSALTKLQEYATNFVDTVLQA